MSALNRHCSAALFEEYFCGVMPEADAADLAAHLVSCSPCRDRAKQISDALLRTNVWLQDTRTEAHSFMKLVEDKSRQISVMGRAATSDLSSAGITPIKLQEKSPARQWVLSDLLPWRRVYEAYTRHPGYALAVATVAICALAWWSHVQRRQLSVSEINLSQAVQSLQQQNGLLSQEHSAPPPQLEQVIESLQNQLRVEVSLRTSLSKWVSDLVTNGEVKPTERVQLAMAAVTTPVTRGAPNFNEESIPLPLTPVRTGIRTTTPTLHWQRVPGTARYSVTLAYAETENDGKVVWEGNAGARDHLTVPSNLLKEGHSYLWQVKARVGQRSLSSPPVGFWVIDSESLRDVEVGEREYQNAALVRAALYERHGLYEEALAEIEHLNKANPKSPAIQGMLRNLRRKLGKDGEGS